MPAAPDEPSTGDIHVAIGTSPKNLYVAAGCLGIGGAMLSVFTLSQAVKMVSGNPEFLQAVGIAGIAGVCAVAEVLIYFWLRGSTWRGRDIVLRSDRVEIPRLGLGTRERSIRYDQIDSIYTHRRSGPAKATIIVDGKSWTFDKLLLGKRCDLVLKELGRRSGAGFVDRSF